MLAQLSQDNATLPPKGQGFAARPCPLPCAHGWAVLPPTQLCLSVTAASSWGQQGIPHLGPAPLAAVPLQSLPCSQGLQIPLCCAKPPP